VLRRSHTNNTALNLVRRLVIDPPWVGLIADGKKTWKEWT
jgi:hypothetical protein